MTQYNRILITGGTGTIGKAILTKAVRELWKSEFVILSRDENKQQDLIRQYAQLEIKCFTGHIQEYNLRTIVSAIQGCDLIVHAAAVKQLAYAEQEIRNTCYANIEGTANILLAMADQKYDGKTILISTAKAAAPVSIYGATKFIAERLFQQSWPIPMNTHVVRLGNILTSTDSVIEKWREQDKSGQPLRINDPYMHLFWLSPSQAADYIFQALEEPAGTITVPVQKSLDLRHLAAYVLGWNKDNIVVGRAKGEKFSEILVAENEWYYTEHIPQKNLYRIYQESLSAPPYNNTNFDARTAEELTKEEVLSMLEEGCPTL